MRESSAPQAGTKGPHIVVEVGGEWLKIAQVESTRGGVAFSRLHLMKSDVPSDDLRTALSGLLAQWKVGRPHVVACLPRQAVNIRMLELPSTDPDEIADMVDLQCGKQTPYSQDEVLSNYSVIGSGRPGYTRVLLAIVQRPLLRQRFAMVEDAGIQIARMTVSTEAVLNWQRLTGAGGPGAFVLLDVDSACTDFVVFSEQGLVFTRSILIGANQLIAEFDKHKERLAREVKQSLDTCMGEVPGLTVSKILITGAGQNIPALVPYLGPHIGLQPEGFDALQSLKRIPSTPSLSDPAYRALSLTSLAGMALGGGSLQMNLVPDSVQTKRGLLGRAKTLTWMAMILMTALVCGSLFAVTSLALKDARLRSLKARIVAATPDETDVKRMREIIRIVGARQDPALAMTTLLKEMESAKPENVYLDSVDFSAEQGQLLIGGLGESIKDIRAFVQNLEQKQQFKDVAEGQTRKDPSGRFKFQIVCSLEAKP